MVVQADAFSTMHQGPGFLIGSTGIDRVSHRPADAVYGHLHGHARDAAPFVRANGPILNVIVRGPTSYRSAIGKTGSR